MSHTILYIEDETTIVELIRDVLEHPEVNLVCTMDAANGFRTVRELRPDLVMLDVLMPQRSGWNIYEEIRADASLAMLPVIMLTGQLHRYFIMKQFSQSAIDAYITKPFDAGELRAEVEKMLGTVFWSKPAVRPGAPGLPEAGTGGNRQG